MLRHGSPVPDVVALAVVEEGQRRRGGQVIRRCGIVDGDDGGAGRTGQAVHVLLQTRPRSRPSQVLVLLFLLLNWMKETNNNDSTGIKN